jgi:predicted Zn-dependent protease
LAAASPLTDEFPENPVFLLVVGDLHAKLGHFDEAAMRFRAAAAAPMEDAACERRVQQLARESLDALAAQRGDLKPGK